jgi:hypothetical protein
MNRFTASCLPALVLVAATPARADEVFGGLLVHDVDSPFSVGGVEDGADLELGWRGTRIRALRFIGSPSPYAFGSVATSGETHFAAAGLSWRIGDRLFVRPGIGLAIHTRSSQGVANGFRTDLGSRVLFEPEVGLGLRINERLMIEASWVHISQAQLFSRQNPGMDSIGVRFSYRLR